MSASIVPLQVPRPTYRGAIDFLGAMAGIGATGVLQRTSAGAELGFRIPTARARRAEVLIGDRSTWSLSLWCDVTSLAMLMAPAGIAVLDVANDEVLDVDLRPLARPAEARDAVVLRHRLRSAEVETPADLFRALAAIGGTVVLRRDRLGLGLGFVAPGCREARLDRLVCACAQRDGDWWLEAVAELGRLFPAAGSLWELRRGETVRLPLAQAGARGRRATP